MKKLKWIVTGYLAGLGTAFWLRSRIYKAVAKYAPMRMTQSAARRSKALKGQTRKAVKNVSHQAANKARSMVGEVKAAMADGREAMRSTENELKSSSYEIQKPNM